MAINSENKHREKKLVSVGNPKVVIFIIGAFRQSRAYAESSLVLTQDISYKYISSQNDEPEAFISYSDEFRECFITISLALLLRIFWKVFRKSVDCLNTRG